MDARRVCLHGLDGIKDCGQGVILNCYAGERFLGNVHGLSRNRDHLLAYKTNHVPREHGLIQKETTNAAVRQLSSGNDRVDAGQRFCLRGINRDNPCVGKRAAQALAVQQTGQPDIGGIAGLPRYL